MPRKRILTFQNGARGRQGRWKKSYRGKTYYLGAGNSRSDFASYNAALEAWEQLKSKLDQEHQPPPDPIRDLYDKTIAEWDLVLAWCVQNGEESIAEEARGKIGELRARYQQKKPPDIQREDLFLSRFEIDPNLVRQLEMSSLASVASPDEYSPARIKADLIAAFASREKRTALDPLEAMFDDDAIRDAKIRWLDRISCQGKQAEGPSVRSLEHWVQTYVAKQLKRVEAGALSPGRCNSVRTSLECFCNWVGGQISIEAIRATTLSHFHGHLLELISNKTFSTAYARDCLSAVRGFIRWLWEQDEIDSLPKNIDSKELRFTSKVTTPQTFEIDEIQSLLKATSGRTRLYIMLALNCGMTQKDIADIQSKSVDWKAGTITRKRSKTQNHESVPIVTHKLWPETLSLLRQERTIGSQLLLLNRNGSPLVTTEINAEGKFRKTDNVKNAFDRTLREVQLSKSFKLLRKTSATLIAADKRFRTLDQLFLGHAPATVAERHYVATDKNALNEALSYLREIYQIALAVAQCAD